MSETRPNVFPNKGGEPNKVVPEGSTIPAGELAAADDSQHPIFWLVAQSPVVN